MCFYLPKSEKSTTFAVVITKIQTIMQYKRLTITLLMSLILPLSVGAQKISLGSTTTKEGGDYQGEMMLGKPHGKGKVQYKNGNIYEGEYVKGKRQGFGIYTFFDGEKYEGEWFQDQQHGNGTYYFSNNNRYEGLWFRDYQHGHGDRARVSIPLLAELSIVVTG